ncbi:MAG: ATP-binding protein, partial [Thermodesulfobacteriota bacterium]|nr:ATP-binding protein [Thermodesulfobacteriota bacterium]
LLAYAQGGKYHSKTILLIDFIEDILPLLRQKIDPAIRIETEFLAGACAVEVDVNQMKMALSAVVINAAEAIEGEGWIRIIARGAQIGKNHPDLKSGRYVCLTVEDDGKGMDEKTRSRIFEPFFSTKFQGRGLGMAATYGIVTNHNGWISVDSELGKGTVAHILLPVVEPKARESRPPKLEIFKGSGCQPLSTYGCHFSTDSSY